MLRAIAAFIGVGLTTLWVAALTVGATVWYTWLIALLALAAFATVGLIPERSSGRWAALCLGLVGLGLLALWLVGLFTPVTPWLPWWTLAAAALTSIVALAIGAQDRLDGFRTRRTI